MIDDSKKYKVSAKNSAGKWWSYGNFSKNQYGNYQIGMKVTDELIKLLEANKGGWINFSLFKQEERQQSEHDKQKVDGYQPNDLDDNIPF